LLNSFSKIKDFLAEHSDTFSDALQGQASRSRKSIQKEITLKKNLNHCLKYSEEILLGCSNTEKPVVHFDKNDWIYF